MASGPDADDVEGEVPEGLSLGMEPAPRSRSPWFSARQIVGYALPLLAVPVGLLVLLWWLVSADGREPTMPDIGQIIRFDSFVTRELAAEDCGLSIDSVKRTGGNRYRVAASARVPGEAHVWLLAHGEEVAGLWWLQLPELPTKTTETSWSVNVMLGGGHQQGDHYGIALVAVDASIHRVLEVEWARSMQNRERPMMLPPGLCQAAVVQVHRQR